MNKEEKPFHYDRNFAAKNKYFRMKVADIAKELREQYVLHGFKQISDDRYVYISVSLVEAIYSLLEKLASKKIYEVSVTARTVYNNIIDACCLEITSEESQNKDFAMKILKMIEKGEEQNGKEEDQASNNETVSSSN